MDIHIQLAGVALGPYTEKQVREYLTDGLLSPSDLARREGNEQWEPVGELLAKLPPPSAELPPVAAAPAEPASVMPPASIPAAPVIVRATPAALKSEEPRKAGPLLVKSLAKKGLVGEKAASSPRTISLEPSLPATSSGKSSRLAAKIPLKTSPAKPAPAAVPAPPPVQSPLGSPPASPVPAPALPSSTDPAPAPAMVKALPLKANPEHKALSDSTKLTSPGTSLPVRVIPKKTPAQTSPPSALAPAKPPETSSNLSLASLRPLAKKVDLPGKAMLPPPSLSASSQAATPSTSPPEKDAPSGTLSPLSASTLKILPKKTAAKPQHTSLIQLAPPVAPAPAAKPADVSSLKTEPPVPTVAPPISESKALTLLANWKRYLLAIRFPAPSEAKPRLTLPWRRFLIPGGMALAVLLLLSALYAAVPYLTSATLRKALTSGDQDGLESTIDFPALRQSLAEQIKAEVASTADQDEKNSAAAAAMATMIDNSINLYVTAPGISALAKTGRFENGDKSPAFASGIATNALQMLNSGALKSEGFVSLGDFVIELDTARLHLLFQGFSWKLRRMELKPHLQLPTSDSSSSSLPSTNSTAPQDSPVIETYLRDGNDKCQKGDWDGAIADFNQVLTINPQETVAYNNRAFARLSKGDNDGAIADYTQAISLDPKLASAFYCRGNARLAKNDLDAALADYTQAINIDPKLTGAYYSRGNARTTKGDFDGAIADYTLVLQLDPSMANAYSNRGFARQAKNDLDAAITDYTQALAIDPKIAVAYYNRGLARQAQGNLDNAILDYNQALDLDPKMAGAYYNRGNAKNTNRDYDGAIADYNQALKLDPKIALAYCNRGLAKQAKGDLPAALADYSEALTLDPSIAVAYYNRGLIKEQTDDLDGAIADSSKALDLDPKEAQAYYNRGFAKLAKGNLEGASIDLRKFCDLAPHDHYADHARLYLWLLSKAQNPNGTASDDLSDSLQNEWNSPTDDLVTQIAGFLLDRISEPALLAAATSSNAKKDQGQHCEVSYFVGMKRLLAGDHAAAVDNFHKCLATDKKDYCEYILAKAELQALDPAPSK